MPSLVAKYVCHSDTRHLGSRPRAVGFHTSVTHMTQTLINAVNKVRVGGTITLNAPPAHTVLNRRAKHKQQALGTAGPISQTGPLREIRDTNFRSACGKPVKLVLSTSLQQTSSTPARLVYKVVAV